MRPYIKKINTGDWDYEEVTLRIYPASYRPALRGAKVYQRMGGEEAIVTFYDWNRQRCYPSYSFSTIDEGVEFAQAKLSQYI